MVDRNVLVVAGSTRPTRRSPIIAEWIANLGREASELSFQLVDLKGLNLGLDDEPGIPAKDDYTQVSTQAWSQQVLASSGVIFVTPQYNWGYPAPLKNAIDHLYREWRDKPAVIVSYGSHGGGKCATQLRQVLEGVNMRVAAAMPALRLSRARIEANDGEVDPAVDFAAHKDELLLAIRELAALVVHAG